MKRNLLIIAFLIPFCLISQRYFDCSFTLINGNSGVYNKINYNYSAERVFRFGGGIKLKWQLNKFGITSGFLFLNQGFRVDLPITDPINPNSGVGSMNARTWIKSLCIPIEFEYYFYKRSSFSFFVTAGAYFSYNIFKKQDNPAYLYNNYPGVIFAYVAPQFVDFNLIDDYMIQPCIGLGIEKKISKNLFVKIKPNYFFQVGNYNKIAKNSTVLLNTFAIDISLTFKTFY